MAKDTKNINIEISYECWKKLKILSISRDNTLQDVIRDVLDKGLSKSKFPDITKEESL